MNLQCTIGELLYIGFVAEKGRCYGGRWNRNYKKTLKNHLSALLSLNNLLLGDGDANKVTKDFFELCKSDYEIGKFYAFSTDVDKIIWENGGDNFKKINIYMKKVLVELLNECNKFHVNRKKVYSLLCIIHNLPRVYLGRNRSTLCNLQQPGISEGDAIAYSFQNMRIEERFKYKLFLEKLEN